MDRLKQLKLPKPTLSDLFFAFICTFLVIYIIAAQTNTGFKFYIVRSGSMKPAVNVGDVAFVTLNSDFSKLQKGDVIAFQSLEFNDIVIHRIIDINSDGYITKGDANEDKDLEPVGLDKVLGIYRFKIPYLGFFFEGIKRVVQLTFVETKFGWILLVGIPVVLVFASRKKHTTSSDKNKDGKIS